MRILRVRAASREFVLLGEERGGGRDAGPVLSLRYSGANFHMSPACGAQILGCDLVSVRAVEMSLSPSAQPGWWNSSDPDQTHRTTHFHAHFSDPGETFFIPDSQHASGKMKSSVIQKKKRRKKKEKPSKCCCGIDSDGKSIQMPVSGQRSGGQRGKTGKSPVKDQRAIL